MVIARGARTEHQASYSKCRRSSAASKRLFKIQFTLVYWGLYYSVVCQQDAFPWIGRIVIGARDIQKPPKRIIAPLWVGPLAITGNVKNFAESPQPLTANPTH